MMPNPRADVALRLDDPQTLVAFCDALFAATLFAFTSMASNK